MIIKCKYLDCKKYSKNDFCSMPRYKCLSCDTRIKSNKLCKDHINPKCKHEKCNRDANYRKLKVGNCTLKILILNIVHIIDPKILLI